MNLEQALNKKEYYTVETLKENSNRVKFISKYEDQIRKIKQRLFDEYNVEKLYITGEILEKLRFSVNNLSIFFEMDKSEFENFIDSYEIKKNIFKGLEVFIESQGIIYTYKNKWRKTELKTPVLLI